MEFIEVVDGVDAEVSKLNAVAELITAQSGYNEETMTGIGNIIRGSATRVKELVNGYHESKG